MAASVEAMLDPWSAALREGKARMQPLFRRPSVAASAAVDIDGLLGRAVWDGDALRAVVRDDAVETLGAPAAVLVIDAWTAAPSKGFLQQGRASCGDERVMERSSAVHRRGGQDHQLPDRCLCRLRVAPRPCLHRPAALPAEGLGG